MGRDKKLRETGDREQSYIKNISTVLTAYLKKQAQAMSSFQDVKCMFEVAFE